MVIELHQFLFSPFCCSVKVLARLLGVEIKEVNLDFRENDHKSAHFLEKNPFHTVPCLVDDGFTVFESRAILLYLLNKYAPDSDLYPKDVKERAMVDAMLNFDSGSLAAALDLRMYSVAYWSKDVPEVFLRKTRDHLKCLDDLLATRQYAAGDKLTVADIAIIHSLILAEVFEEDLTCLAHLTEYIKRVKEDIGNHYKDVNENGVEAMKSFVKSVISL